MVPLVFSLFSPSITSVMLMLPMVSMVKASRDDAGKLLLIAASNDGRLQLLESKT